MRKEFGFLSYPGTYAAEVPEHMQGVEYATTVVVDGLHREVVFALGDADEAARSRGQVPSRALPGRLGRAIAYDQVGTQQDDLLSAPRTASTTLASEDEETPQTTFLYWQLGSGYLRTHVYPGLDRSGTISALAGGLRPYRDAAGRPRLALGSRLGRGDLRQPVERDSVMFSAAAPGAEVTSVSFIYAAALAGDGESRNGRMSTVARSGPLGVTVACDGARAAGTRLRSETEAIASSVELLGG
jgi:hypothetical protein